MFRLLTQKRVAIDEILAIPIVTRLISEKLENVVFVSPENLQAILLGTGDDRSVHIPTNVYVSAAKQLQSKHLILIHNHPTEEDGWVDPRPTHEDWQVTYFVRELLAELGISLMDHLVVSVKGVYSYRFRRLIHNRHTL